MDPLTMLVDSHHIFLSSFPFVILFRVNLFILFIFLFITSINLLMFVPVRKYCCQILTNVLVFKFRGRSGISTLQFFIPRYCISCHIGDNVSFKFGGVDKHTVCLFVCLFLSIYIYIYIYCNVVVKHET